MLRYWCVDLLEASKSSPPPLPHPHWPGFQTKTLKTFSSKPFARQSELFAFKHHHIEI